MKHELDEVLEAQYLVSKGADQMISDAKRLRAESEGKIWAVWMIRTLGGADAATIIGPESPYTFELDQCDLILPDLHSYASFRLCIYHTNTKRRIFNLDANKFDEQINRLLAYDKDNLISFWNFLSSLDFASLFTYKI